MVSWKKMAEEMVVREVRFQIYSEGRVGRIC